MTPTHIDTQKGGMEKPPPIDLRTIEAKVMGGQELSPEERGIVIGEINELHRKNCDRGAKISRDWAKSVKRLADALGIPIETIEDPGSIEDMRLIPDGKEAFDALGKLIQGAKKSIVINMFVWRDDEVGNDIARQLLEAAKRNPELQISIRKDRLGATFEWAELGKKSFWHLDPTPEELDDVSIIDKRFDDPHEVEERPEPAQNPLARELLSLPNVKVEHGKVLNDHSKYVIVDDEVVWTGGRNFGDEYRDRWRDLTAVIRSKAVVEHFRRRWNQQPARTQENGVDLSLNIYDTEKKALTLREIAPTFSAFMEESQSGSRVIIEMAYFGDPETTRNIIEAAQRGVKIDIVTAQKSNLQDDLNKMTLQQIMREGGGNVTVYLHPKMVHTKAWIGQSQDDATGEFVWDRLSFGSANLNAQAINQLGETNLVFRDRNCPLIPGVLGILESGKQESRAFENPEDITFSEKDALLEQIVSQNGKALKSTYHMIKPFTGSWFGK